ncbi:MAG: hypothetical protein ACI9H6_000144 [Patiriisocius sp.]|jgi:hypothetical protein
MEKWGYVRYFLILCVVILLILVGLDLVVNNELADREIRSLQDQYRLSIFLAKYQATFSIPA